MQKAGGCRCWGLLCFGLAGWALWLFAACAPLHAEGGGVRLLTASIQPYSHDDPKQPGVVIELVRAALDEAGLQVRADFLPWARAQLMVQRMGGRVLITPLTRTPEREALYTWVAPVLEDSMELMALDPSLDLRNLAAMRNLKVGVLRESPGEYILRKEGFTAIDPGVDELTNARKLQHGRTPLWMTRGMSGVFCFRQVGGDPARLVRGYAWETRPIYLAASLDFPPAVAGRIRRAMRSLREDGRYDAIVGRYR